MDISDDTLIKRAVEATKKVRQLADKKKGWKFMGYVGTALLTNKGNIFTGINIELNCGIGFCAEHSAVAEMIKNGETHIKRIIATTAQGTIIPPCGRCREMLYQIDELNSNAEVIISASEKKLLRDLLPYNWQKQFDRPLY
jgi:cytidine deaminase